MPIPSEVRTRAEEALAAFATQHSTEGGDGVRYAYSFETNAALLLAQKPGFLNPNELVSTAVAKFRYSEARDEWSLYWFDANNKSQRVSGVKASKNFNDLLQAVVTDSLGVFWS